MIKIKGTGELKRGNVPYNFLLCTTVYKMVCRESCRFSHTELKSQHNVFETFGYKIENWRCSSWSYDFVNG